MPDNNDNMLTAAGAAGAAGVGVNVLSAQMDKRSKARESAKLSEIQKKRDRIARRRKQPAAIHPKKKLAEAAQDANPAMFKKIVKGQRLAARAAKASTRGLGAIGAVANAPGMIRDAQSISAEGGKFAARFGKFVERSLGLPAGTTGRPMTDKEQRAATLY